MGISDEMNSSKNYGMDSTDGVGNRKTSSSVKDYETSWKFWKKRRYVVATLAFFGFFNAYCLRVNMSIAVVAMTQNRVQVLENGTEISLGPEFNWDNEMQGYVLSSFFYGYITTQILGGYFAGKFGGKMIFGTGIAITALLTLVTPWLASINVYLLIAVRIVMGVFEGVTYPCIHAIWAKWAPPMERSRLATIAFSGSYAGTVVAMPACAYLANAFGWASIFYFWGIIGLIWYALWYFIIQDSPGQDPKITRWELEYIESSLEVHSGARPPVPWRSIVRSRAVWAIVVSHFSENWGYYTLLTQLPKYLKDIHNYDLGKSGFLSGLPYLVMAILMQFAGQWADWFRVKRILSTTQVRIIFNCTGFVSQTVFMLAAAFWSDRIGTVFCLTLAVGLGAFAWAGFSVNHLDIAPQYASVLMGFGNTFATLPGILSPILSGYVVSTANPQPSEWQIVFYVSAGIYLFGALIYGTNASGNLQPWAMDEKSSMENDKKGKSVENNGGKYGFENKNFAKDEDL